MTVDLYKPRTMGKIVQQIPPQHNFFSTFFKKHTETFLTAKVDVDIMKGGREMAPFVNPLTGSKTMKNHGFKTKTYEPPLISPSTVTSADDIMNRMMGESIYSQKTPAQRAAVKMAQDFKKLDVMISRTEEWMCSKVLLDGKIPIVGDDYEAEIDFDFDNKEVLSGDDLWTSENSDPIADIEEWHEVCQKEGFVNCDILVLGKRAANAFINHPKVKSLLDIKNLNLAIIEPKKLPNGVTYIGTYPKLNLSIYTYNEWFYDSKEKKTKPMMPSHKALLFSSKADCSMYYGAHTKLNSKTDLFETIEASRIPDTWIKKNPDRRFLGLSSKPLPVPHEVDSWYVADVVEEAD
ncbi:MAG: major capsid protein [Tissierellales bacterium]|jgi:hypothetical protein|nr:major capsid protein [Tissierellales bacterium]